jgi:hypothetical protein
MGESRFTAITFFIIFIIIIIILLLDQSHGVCCLSRCLLQRQPLRLNALSLGLLLGTKYHAVVM